MLNYSDYAIVFDWEVLNNKQDIGKWEMLYEDNNKKVYGNGMNDFMDEITQLPQNKINVMFINNLNMFEVIASNYMSFKDNFRAVVKERGINFFYISPFDFLEFRNSNNFWESITTDEFLRRLNLCREGLKCRNKNRLDLKTHFQFTITKDVWWAITKEYFLDSITFRKIRNDLMPKTQIELDLLLSAYKASFVYANPNYLHQTLCDVYSSDIKSSHCGFFLRKRYPFGEAQFEEDPHKVKEIMENDFFAWIGRFHVIGLKEKIEDFPWDMRNFGIKQKDGSWIITLLSPHWKTFKRIYGAEAIFPIDFIYYKQSPLISNYIKMINSLYIEKEQMKMNSKDPFIIELYKMRTELPYGQSIKNPIFTTQVIYDKEENNFIIDRLPRQSFNEIIKELKKHVLPFQYGLWTAAYSWAEEVNMILDIGLDNIVYGDTDSVKYLNEEGLEVIKRHNKEIDKEIEAVCKKYNIRGLIDSKIGRWHDDGFNVCFKTLGMKRYLSFKENGALKATCSGARIDTLQEYVDDSEEPFEDFDKEMKVTGLYKHVSIDRKRGTVHVSYGDCLEDIG